MLNYDPTAFFEITDPQLISLTAAAGSADHDGDEGGVRVGGLGGNDVLMFDVLCTGGPTQGPDYRLHYYDKTYEPNLACWPTNAKGDNYACVGNLGCYNNTVC